MPLSLDLAYKTPKHAKILDALLRRFDASAAKMSERHAAWKKTEETFKAYTTETSENAIRRARREQGKREFVDLVIPYSYAMLLASHTYWSSVFLSRNPIFQIAARHGESQQQVQGLESIIDYQVQVGQMIVPLYIWLLDAGKYGFGVLGNYWANETQQISRIIEVEEPKTILGFPIPGATPTKKKKRETLVVQGYQGNRVYNVRPLDFFPDPRVPLVGFQKGEFCARRTIIGWDEMLSRGRAGEYINLEAARSLRPVFGDSLQLSSQEALPTTNLGIYDEMEKRGFSNVIEMHIKLVPKDWGLGSSEEHEKWVFTIAEREIIIGARPLEACHDQFPFFLQSYEIDGYSQTSRGMLEITRPLDETLSWLINSHFQNVRKSIDGDWIVDPSRVVMKDFEEEGPSRMIRLRSTAYGTDVRSVISQMPATIATGMHLQGLSVIMDLIQRVTGCNDNIMGQLNPGGRKTATEVRTSSSFGINRLRTFAEYNSALGWSPLTQVLIQNTQQYYDTMQSFKIAGDLMALGSNKFVQVDPSLIAGFYDFVPVDGTLPIDRFAQATLWKELLLGMAKMPMLLQQFDVAGIFSWMAQLAGLKNINQFKLKIVPDATVAAAAQAGNMIPAETALQGSSPDVGGGATSMQMANMASL